MHSSFIITVALVTLATLSSGLGLKSNQPDSSSCLEEVRELQASGIYNYEDTSSQVSYFTCEDEGFVKHDCPDGEHFDAETQVCEPYIFCDPSQPGMGYVDLYNFEYYYKCEPHPVKYKCEDNEYFDELKSQSCKAYFTCDGKNEVGLKYTNDYFNDNNNTYFTCESGKAVRHACLVNEMFKPESQSCEAYFTCLGKDETKKYLNDLDFVLNESYFMCKSQKAVKYNCAWLEEFNEEAQSCIPWDDNYDDYDDDEDDEAQSEEEDVQYHI